MLSATYKSIEKPKTYPLLIAFFTISIFSLFETGRKFISDPVSLDALAIPVICIFAYIIVWYWFDLIRFLNYSLSDNDMACFGTWIGCSILVFCIAVTLNFFAINTESLSADILVEPEFIQIVTLYFLGIETIKIRRFNFDCS